jgi:DNA-nicking Smr family endonuclease
VASAKKPDSFRDLAPAVKPLPARPARVPEPEKTNPPPAVAAVQEPRLPPLAVERGQEWARGSADGVDKKRLTKLSRGEPRPVASIDVHGKSAEEARRAVARFVRTAHERGQRSVLVIFGRGLHSGPRGPVLRDEMLTLLSEALSDQVLAFCSAPGPLGGSGAFMVLLRRPK